MRRIRLTERKFSFNDLTDTEIDQLYNNFKDTYEGSTGASWSFNDFEWRAKNWEFYGDIHGGIAVRPQRSGLLKLNASFGEVDPSNPSQLSKKGMMGVMSGIKELMATNPGVGIWGAMPKDMVKVLEIFTKRNNPDDYFKAAPAPLVLVLGAKLLSMTSSSGHNASVVKNPLSKDFGCIEVDTPSGRMAKQFVANKSYYQWIKDQAADKSNALVQDAVSKLGGLGKFISHLPFVNSNKSAVSENNMYIKVYNKMNENVNLTKATTAFEICKTILNDEKAIDCYFEYIEPHFTPEAELDNDEREELIERFTEFANEWDEDTADFLEEYDPDNDDEETSNAYLNDLKYASKNREDLDPNEIAKIVQDACDFAKAVERTPDEYSNQDHIAAKLVWDYIEDLEEYLYARGGRRSYI